MELQTSMRKFHPLRKLCLLLLGFLSLIRAECRFYSAVSNSFNYQSINCRAHSVSLKDFGGVGDGVTSNTKAFAAAISNLSHYQQKGGGLLYIPPGRWVTGSFNLTSSLTIFLHRDAVILGSQDMNEWPLIDPLPSYGRGRDAPGGRYSSLIMGSKLTDVVITGDNGTIDGQGAMWWDKFHNDELKYTRGYLIEILFSDMILISNLKLVNSPSWHVHPTYSSNVIIKGLTISAPVTSPNTDGIDPDSCTNVRIEDSHVVSGDDCIAIKSGWDEYGIKFGMPTKHVIIRRFSCVSPDSATIALGSEMSGGIQDIRAEDITAINTQSAVRIKTTIGRGGFVKDIFAKGFTMHNMKYVFWMTGTYGQHADDHFNPNAIPAVNNINYLDMVATNVTIAGKLEGIEKGPFTGICISNTTMEMFGSKKLPWNCTHVSGSWTSVTPQPCPSLVDQGRKASPCSYPTDKLPIEDVQLKECTFNG